MLLTFNKAPIYASRQYKRKKKGATVIKCCIYGYARTFLTLLKTLKSQ